MQHTLNPFLHPFSILTIALMMIYTTSNTFYLHFRPNPPKMAATVPSKKIGGGSGAAGQREYTVRALTWHARHATSKSQEKKEEKTRINILTLT